MVTDEVERVGRALWKEGRVTLFLEGSSFSVKLALFVPFFIFLSLCAYSVPFVSWYYCIRCRCGRCGQGGDKWSDTMTITKGIISSLSQNDYVSVVCARRSHNDYWGNFRYYRTSVISCQRHALVRRKNKKTTKTMKNKNEKKSKGNEKNYEKRIGKQEKGKSAGK